MTGMLGWLLGLENATSIDEIDPSFAASWAAESAFWGFFGVVVLTVLSLWFYLKRQPRGPWSARLALGLCRGLLLALLFLTLANPVLRVSLTNRQPPLVYVVLDGTESMEIEDPYSETQRAELSERIGLGPEWKSRESVTRMECLRAFLQRPENNVLQQLADAKGFRIEVFQFDGNSTSQLRKLRSSPAGSGPFDASHVAGQLTSPGQVTALGAVLNDAGQQFGAGNMAAMVLFSDFAHNAGASPVGGGDGESLSPAQRLRVPVYTIGIGATETIDLAVDLQTDPKMKRNERTVIAVNLRHDGLQDQAATVRVSARPLSGSRASGEGQTILVGQQTVALRAGSQSIDFPFTPEDAGRFEFMAEVDPAPGESVVDNNRAAREVNIIDDYLRLMYVDYEPSWEWRFVKEVFHRDKLVGMDGFRTYLASSDPQVRETNILFLPTLTPKRSEFFANDVIFLGDMPRSALTDRFCEMTREFVGRFGGGLVVIAGPRFGPAQLRGTALEDMLPVILDPESRLRDERSFRLQRTIHADRYPFMQLGGTEVENTRAWNNLRLLPWYQPVAQVHDQAFVLAEHPADTCLDGRTPQPLIAIRQFGAGEVVYLGFDEMWRLRRMYGERYYREFWSQLIYRLGMSHALGAEKRFVARTDRQEYRVEDRVTVTVEAYNENFDPLVQQDLPGGTLSAELTVSRSGGFDTVRELTLSMLRPGVFEASIPASAAGVYHVRVKDPVGGGFNEIPFTVTGASAERRSGIRNRPLQEQLAQETGGRSYELVNAQQLLDDLQLESVAERYTRSYPLWATPLWFLALVGLMLGEWFSRKMINLS
ncbi:MAG: VWA domain-containing protein [Pirellulaceae bacterium]|nr:VWA domain-containing protein [Pirellulaceae bacterium]